MLQGRQQALVFALGAAQYGVEQTLGRGLLQLVDTAHRLANGGMGRDAGVEQLVETDQQQGFEIAVAGLEGLLQELFRQQRQPRLPARGTKGQVLGQGAVTWIDLGQLLGQAAAQGGTSGQDRGQGTGGRQPRIHRPST